MDEKITSDGIAFRTSRKSEPPVAPQQPTLVKVRSRVGLMLYTKATGCPCTFCLYFLSSKNVGRFSAISPKIFIFYFSIE